MIVFWRLFLAYFLTDFVFFHKTINQIRNENRARGMISTESCFYYGVLPCVMVT